MFKIQINGGFLVLFPSQTIEHKYFSPFFTTGEVIRDDITIPFDVPNDADGVNAGLLGRAHIITNSDTFLEDLSARLFIGDVPALKGLVNINDADDTKFNITFKSGPGAISSRIKQMSLRELMNERFSIYDSIQEKQVWLSATGQAAYKVQVNGQNYSAVSIELLATAITNGDATVTVTWAGGTPDELGIKPAVDPTDMASALEVQIPTDTNYWNLVTAKMNTWIDAYWQGFKDGVYNYQTAGGGTQKVRFTTTFNRENGRNPNKVTEAINGYNNSRLTAGFSIVLSTYRPLNNNSGAAYVNVPYVLDKIEAEFGITFKGPLRESAALQELLLFHPNTLDSYQKFINEIPFLFWKGEVNLRNLVPDITVANFIKRLAGVFKMIIEYDAEMNTITFVSSGEVLSGSEYIDVSDKAGPLVGINNQVPGGFELVQIQPGSDQFDLAVTDETNPYEKYVVGTGEERLPIAATGITQYDGFPYVDEGEGESFPLRLMFYNGEVANASGTYHAANINNGTYSLSWFGANGLFEKFWKAYITYRQNEASASTTIRYTVADLVGLNKLKKIRLPDGLFLIKELSVQAASNQLRAARVKISRVRANNVVAEVAAPVLAWRGQESSALCLIDGSSFNTGVKRYVYLEEYDTNTTLATGGIKLNSVSDPDYEADTNDLVSCPIQAADVVAWAAAPNNPFSLSVAINYNNTGGYSLNNLPDPAPYNLPDTFFTLDASNSSPARIRLTATVRDAANAVVITDSIIISEVVYGDVDSAAGTPSTGQINLSFQPTAGSYNIAMLIETI